MRIDVHTHIFPQEIVGDRGPFFHGEPIFKQLYDSPKARLVTAESLLQAMDMDEVDRAVVFGFPWHSVDVARKNNDYVLEAAAKYAPRLIPMGCVHPLGDGSAEEAQRCLEAGAKGLGELAVYEACTPDFALKCYADLIACCRSHNAILLVHANEPVGHWYPGKAPMGLDFYYELARLTAGIPLVLAHWGGGLCFYELLKKEAPQVLSQVYYDTAASPFLYRPVIYSQVSKILGSDKVLFGSDYPLLPPRRYFKEMEEACLSAEEIRSITGENAQRLFGV